MPSGPSVLHFSKDIAQRLLDLSGWHARTFEFLGIGSDERLNFNRVSRFDTQHGGRLRVVVPEHDCLGRWLEQTSRRSVAFLSARRWADEEKQGDRQNHDVNGAVASAHRAFPPPDRRASNRVRVVESNREPCAPAAIVSFS